jgi:hypothetical protein
MPGFVLLSNPDLWPVQEKDVLAWEKDIAALRRGETVVVRWSTGSRHSGISPGDPLVLMRTSADGGVVTVGTALDGIFLDEHWDGSGRLAPYVEAELLGWAGEDPLPRDLLRTELPLVKWPPQASGMQLADSDLERVLQLWRDHVGSDSLQTTTRRGHQSRTDAVRNRAVELRAMAVTRQAMLDLEWGQIRDTSASQPYDFQAMSPEGLIRVEVKGLSGIGDSVEITHGELESAQEHLTALAVVRGIEVSWRSDGSAVGRGGQIVWESPWSPDASRLKPIRFRYRLP